MDDGEWVRPSAGSPQGGVISPLLSNVYLHTVLDEWFEEVVLPRMGSSCRLVRYADDFVMLLREKRDASAESTGQAAWEIRAYAP